MLRPTSLEKVEQNIGQLQMRVCFIFVSVPAGWGCYSYVMAPTTTSALRAHAYNFGITCSIALTIQHRVTKKHASTVRLCFICIKMFQRVGVSFKTHSSRQHYALLVIPWQHADMQTCRQIHHCTCSTTLYNCIEPHSAAGCWAENNIADLMRWGQKKAQVENGPKKMPGALTLLQEMDTACITPPG